jgi:hypothetical protein
MSNPARRRRGSRPSYHVAPRNHVSPSPRLRDAATVRDGCHNHQQRMRWLPQPSQTAATGEAVR